MGLFLSGFLVLRTHGYTTKTQVYFLSFALHGRKCTKQCGTDCRDVTGSHHCCFSGNPFSLLSLLVWNWRLLVLLRVSGMLCGQTWKGHSRAWLWGRGEGTMEPGGLPGKGMGQLWNSLVVSPMAERSKAGVVEWGRRSLQIFRGKIPCSFQLGQWLPFINLDNLFHPM